MSKQLCFERVRIGGVDFHSATEAEVAETIVRKSASGLGGVVITVNLDHLLRCKRSARYRELVRLADLVVADGQPIVWASKLQGTPLPQRVAGSSLSVSLAEAMALGDRSLFLLGGDPGVANRAANKLSERFVGLKIAGTFCPPFGFEKDPAEIEKIRLHLATCSPDVIYVALGSPKQEELIELLKQSFPNAWWIGVGISLSFISGDVKRAPRWVQKSGVEWLHRLIQEPRRLAKRYLIDGIPFAFELLSTAACQRFR